MTEGYREVNEGGEGMDRVTISEATTLLGVHPNTVRSRVKDGTYEAEKILTERGTTWMIDRNSLITNTLPSGSQAVPSQTQQQASAQATELVQDLLRPFVEDLGRVREELGAERVRREQAEHERDELAARLKAIKDERESSIEATEQPASSDVPPERETTPEQRPEEERRSWWRRFFGIM